MDSLSKRQHDYVFYDQSSFQPVARDTIHGANATLLAFDEIVRLLCNFKEFAGKGIELPGGALLHGPKGTGKTYFARYLATVTGLKMVDINALPRRGIHGRESVLGAEDIRRLFQLGRRYVAEKKRPIIFFCDEFGAGETEVTRELRVQLDGLQGRPHGIFCVFASTSGPALHDDKLFRHGRMSIHIPFTHPTPEGRLAQLRFYTSLYPHDPRIDLRSIAYLLHAGTTPAVIRDLLRDAYNDAVLERVERNTRLEQKHLLRRALQELVGFVTDESLSPEEKLKVAHHEAGHALLGRVLGIPVQAVTILPRTDSESSAHGTTFCILSDEKLLGVEKIEDWVVMFFGGMVVDEFLGASELTGAQTDRERINDLAMDLVCGYSRDKKIRKHLGCIVLDFEKFNYSERVKEMGERGIARVLRRAERRAWQLVRRLGKKRIRTIGALLFERKILLQQDIDRFL